VPSPVEKKADGEFRSLIFDSTFSEFKGVISYIRVFDGEVKKGDRIRYMATNVESEVIEVGTMHPAMMKREKLGPGDIGYIITGIKEIENCRVGDTIAAKTVEESLGGYKEVVPMVYAGIFCQDGSDYERLRTAIAKLKLNDSALVYDPEHSNALGFGFRCGFLGMLHLEIFQERLAREYSLELVVTVPSVAYHVGIKGDINKLGYNVKSENKIDDQTIIVSSAADLPDPTRVDYIEEPIMNVDIVAPADYIGGIMSLVQEKRGIYVNTEYLGTSASDNRVLLHYKVPLATIIVDFYDKLKSVTSGYASLNYEFSSYERTDVAKLDISVAGDKVEALSSIVYKDEAHQAGKAVVKMLKEALPRQMFEIKLQAMIGHKVVASERISAFRKDVTSGLYGGDFSRKKKLLQKQKAGKKRMAQMGRVEIPSNVFLKVLKK
jgi:GTP-binding protein LepA